MDAGFYYELSIDSSSGIAASGDLPSDSGDHATDRVEEGSLPPTTIRPVEESISSKDKASSGSHNSGTSPASGDPFSPANPAEEGIKHAFCWTEKATRGGGVNRSTLTFSILNQIQHESHSNSYESYEDQSTSTAEDLY